MASELETFSVDLNGFSSRVWKKGEGPPLGFLAGFGGLPRWIPFLDYSGARAHGRSSRHCPGSPAASAGIRVLDSHLDWMLAVRHLLQKAGLEGADLAGSSVGGFVCRRNRGDLAGLGPPPGFDRPMGSVRRKGSDDRPLGAAGRPRSRRSSAPTPSAGTSSRPSPKARTRPNGRSSRRAPTRPRRAPSGRSAIRGSKSAYR